MVMMLRGSLFSIQYTNGIYISKSSSLLLLTSSSDISKQTLTQLNAPSTGKGGGTSFGNRCRRGLTNNGLVF